MKKNRFYILSIVLFFYCAAFSQIVNPLNITGLAGWYSTDSIGLTNGSLVPAWNDLSGNNNHLTQSNALNQGTLYTNQLNNKPCVRLDGVNTFYSFTDSVDFRTVIVVNKVNEATFPSYKGLFAGTLSSFGVGGYLINGKAGTTEIYQGVNTGNLSKMLRNNVSVFATADFSPLNTYWIGNWEFTTNRKQTAELGRMDNGTQAGWNWNGDMFEIIIYNRILTVAESDDIFDYLNDKYAPPVDLGPDISVTNSFCDTILSATKPYETYLWSTGAITPTISVNTSGKYWLRAVNFFGVTSSDTILVNYPGYHQITQNVICSGGQMNWSTLLPKSDYTFLWQDGSTTDSVYTITQAGNYFVTISDGFGCSITSNTLTVTQDNFSSTASLGPDISKCAGNLITLVSGASASNSYTWSTGSNNDSLLINITGPYSVVVTNSNNCVAKDTIIVTISGQAPTANFSSNIGCQNRLVTFTNLSIPPSGNSIDSTIWSFGDLSASNTSTLTNPAHTYSNTGTYTVSLKVITDSGCAQSIIKQITVSPVPTATFAFGTSCQNDTTAFISQSTGAPGFSITSTKWNFGDTINNTSNLIAPKHIFGSFTTYTVKLVVTNSAGCKDSVSMPVAVRAEVSANFTNGPACINNPTQFQSTSIIPSGTTTYSWTIAGSYFNTLTPVKTFTNSGVYFATLYVDGNNGCTSSITKLVNVYLPPVANFSVPSFCSKDTITAINSSMPQSGIMSSYNWRLNNVSFSALQSPTLSLIPSGTYSVRLTVANSFGCKDSTSKPLTVYPLPLVDFTTNPAAYYYLNEPVDFIPSITNASSYLWNISSAPTSTLQSPTETFNAEGSYTVSLNLKDLMGCKGSKTKTISVLKRHLDLAILNITTTKDNDGFMTVVADMANYGSVPITSFKIHYQISDAGYIKETWTGNMGPNSFYVYTFNGTSASLQSSTNNITCVELEKINSTMDDNTINNSMCNTLNTDDISVSNPIPNPTDGDIILPITLNRDLDYTIAIYNSVGQIMYEETTRAGTEGLNFVRLSTSSYARGCYIIKVMIDGKVFIKKFIKISFE